MRLRHQKKVANRWTGHGRTRFGIRQKSLVSPYVAFVRYKIGLVVRMEFDAQWGFGVFELKPLLAETGGG